MRAPHVLAALLAVAALAALSRPPAAVDAATCSVTASGPFIHKLNPTSGEIFGTGRFRCSDGPKDQPVTVALQEKRKGKWANVAKVSRTVNFHSGKQYTVRTKPLTCAANPVHQTMRTKVTVLPTRHGEKPGVVTSGAQPFFCLAS